MNIGVLDANVISAVVNLGSAAAVIIVVWLFLAALQKAHEEFGTRSAALVAAHGEQIAALSRAQDARIASFVDRLDRIESRHMEDEKASRDQLVKLFGQVRDLAGRTVDTHLTLANSINGLDTATRAQADLARASVRQFAALSKVKVVPEEPPT